MPRFSICGSDRAGQPQLMVQKRSNSSELDPVAQGQSAIGELSAGYRKVASLALPPSSFMALAHLRKAIAALEGQIGQVAMGPTSSVEQERFSNICPGGGTLLRKYNCAMAIGDEELIQGELFVSDSGLNFEAFGGAAPLMMLGLFAWGDLDIARCKGKELEIVAVSRPGTPRLRICLPSPADVEFIQVFWGVLRTSDYGNARVEDSPVETWKITVAKAPNRTAGSPMLLQQLGDLSVNQVDGKIREVLEVGTIREVPEVPEAAASPRVHRCLSTDASLEKLYAEAPGGRKTLELPPADAQVGTDTIDSLNLAGIISVMEASNWLTKFLQKAKEATNIAATSWVESTGEPGVMVRKVTFTTPVPQDFPRAVTRLVNLPTETSVTSVFRMQRKADQILITVQFCSHDVPYGENFHVHETLLLKPGSSGIATTSSVEVMWVQALPWTHGILKSVIESKCKADPLVNRLINALKAEKQPTPKQIAIAPPAAVAPTAEPVISPVQKEEEQSTVAQPQPLLEESTSPKVHRSITTNSTLSRCYIEAPAGRSPTALPPADAQVGTDVLPSLNLAAIAAKMESDNWLTKFLQKAKEATNIAATSWVQSKSEPGVMVRKVTFTTPVPQDFPRAVTRLVNLPTETSVTSVFRMQQKADQMLITVQFCSHDVPYGENFHVHETLLLKPGSSGVATTSSVEIMWVQALPWTHGILKSVIESKCKADPLANRLINALKA